MTMAVYLIYDTFLTANVIDHVSEIVREHKTKVAQILTKDRLALRLRERLGTLCQIKTDPNGFNLDDSTTLIEGK